MAAFDRALRVPVALVLGSVVFAVGFVHLVALSTRFTTDLLRGESPAQTLSRLQQERERRHRDKS
jgi:hypothetical protein